MGTRVGLDSCTSECAGSHYALTLVLQKYKKGESGATELEGVRLASNRLSSPVVAELLRLTVYSIPYYTTEGEDNYHNGGVKACVGHGIGDAKGRPADSHPFNLPPRALFVGWFFS